MKNRIALALSLIVFPAAASAADSEPQLLFAASLDSTGAQKLTLAAENLESLPQIEVPIAPPLPQAIDLTNPPDDLLTRIRHGFSMPNLSSDLVLHHQSWYLNRPDLVRRIVERSSRYLHYIVEELDKRGMPMELALLPMIESSYNPMALSPARASGLWQFIPSTGRNYKLEQNSWIDERRDIVASTGAALDYLQTIYDMHGDWHLALASYNWGENAVARAIAKNQARGLATDYLSLTMPPETRNYVPKLQALKNILSTPTLITHLDLPAIPNKPYFSTIAKPANMDIRIAAKLAEMPVKEFVALNPANNGPVIREQQQLVLPADKVEVFQNNLENHDEPLSSWQPYTLKRGERLDQVASRHGISLSQLKHANGLGPKTRLGPGSSVMVPTSREALSGLTAMPGVAVEPPAAPTKGKRNSLAKAKPTKLAMTKGKTAKGVKTSRGGRTTMTIAARSTTAGNSAAKANPGPTRLARK